MYRNELLKIGFDAADMDYICELLKYEGSVSHLVREYAANIKTEPTEPYGEGERTNSHKKAIAFTEKINKALPQVNEYEARLLGWILCIPYFKEHYKKYGVCEDIFYQTAQDLSIKSEECKVTTGKTGLLTDWFFLILEMKLFALGRLQYEVSSFEFERYSYKGITIKKGDRVYSCHIPSGGKLTTQMCMDSFKKAYEFFKPALKSDIIPIISHTWLLYKPYIECVFPKGSNIEQFARLFDVIDTSSTANRFDDAWRVFNMAYDGNTKALPCDNTLRRNFIEYIDDGGDFGYGYGVILYNGVTGEIVNHK